MKYILYTDGGARGNPGPAGTGAVLQSAGKVIWEAGAYIGKATNNQAEYQALIAGLEHARDLQASEVECFLDSELLVKQMNREYKVKDKDLAPLFLKVWNLSVNFKKVTFTHIPREQNKEADRLVNEALDKALKIV
jgi:ribonuclease HI